MIELINQQDGLEVRLTAILMGDDLSVTISGGGKPHIGAVALAVPTPSQHTPGKINASVSVLTLTGHREDDLARQAADSLARALKRIVVVCCGIHQDAATQEEIQAFITMTNSLVRLLSDTIIKNKQALDDVSTAQ